MNSFMFVCASLAIISAVFMTDVHANRDMSVSRDVVCKVYRAPPHSYAITAAGNIQAAVVVNDRFNVLDIAVGVNITHPSIGDLKLVLENREPCRMSPGVFDKQISCLNAEKKSTRLLSNFGGDESDMYNTFFDDYAVKSLNKENHNQAPFTGIFRPDFSLKRMIRGVDGRKHRAAKGGSMGTWLLTVTDRDVASNESRGSVEGFEIILCTREKEGVEMPYFIPFNEAMRKPASMPVQDFDEPEPPQRVIANSGTEESSFTIPFLADAQEYFSFIEGLFLFNYAAAFYSRLFLGRIPHPPFEGDYLLSDPIPYDNGILGPDPLPNLPADAEEDR